jgi:hypothetical protein
MSPVAGAIPIHYAIENVEEDQRRFIKLLKPATLTHEEHHTLTIKAGLYEVLKEQEFDFVDLEAFRVND